MYTFSPYFTNGGGGSKSSLEGMRHVPIGIEVQGPPPIQNEFYIMELEKDREEALYDLLVRRYRTDD